MSARIVDDLLILAAVFTGLYVYERLRVRYHRAADAKNRPSLRETFENAEWEAILRMRRTEQALVDSRQRFAVGADRTTSEPVGVAAGTAAAAAEE
jgi:hypothetical protein